MFFIEKQLPEYREIDNKMFMMARHQPAILRKYINQQEFANLGKKKIKDKLPNIRIQVVKSLKEKFEPKSTRRKYYCKLHDFLDYCEGKRIEFLVTEGNFDHKRHYFSKSELVLYALSLNCNKRQDLSDLVKIESLFGDWFQSKFPKYTKEVVYDKGHTWFFIGPENCVSELHYDHNHVHTILRQYKGRKEVFLIDPRTTRALIEENGNCIEFTKTDGGIEIKDSEGKYNTKRIPIFYGILKSRDILYIPSNWGHMVRSIEPSLTISRDFIDDRNVDDYFTSIMLSAKKEREGIKEASNQQTFVSDNKEQSSDL